MRRVAPASFFLGLTLATGASAGPIDDDGAKSELETAYAPVPQAGTPEAVQQSARAASGVNPDAAAQGANPLWTIPLSSLTATRDRPLFSASRRPASLAVQTPPPPPPAPHPAPATPASPTLELVGTIVGPATSLAMVKDPATHAVTRLREGEEASGWRLKTVTLRSIIVEKGEQSAVLALPERLETSGQQAAQNHPPLKDKKEPGSSPVYRQKPR